MNPRFSCLPWSARATSQAPRSRACMEIICAQNTNDLRSVRRLRAARIPSQRSGLHNAAAVKEFEHRSFLAGLARALDKLAGLDRISYQDVLDTHKTQRVRPHRTSEPSQIDCRRPPSQAMAWPQ